MVCYDKSIMTQSEKKKHIVLIEDEETLANIMRLKLQKAGYEVSVEGDGDKAIDLITSQKPDLVLLDILLPGKNGFDILEGLHEAGMLPALPVIVISNSGQPVELNKILSFGVRDYLIKINFSPQEVLEKVRQVLSPDAHAPEENHEKKRNHQPAGAPSLLVVEDDAILSNLIERKFSQQNFQVYRALSVAEARRILEEETIDVILLDIVLPDMDGFAFLAELKGGQKTKHIPVIIVSNLGQKEEIERGIGAGAVDYIIKANVLPQEIYEKVEHILHKK